MNNYCRYIRSEHTRECRTPESGGSTMLSDHTYAKRREKREINEINNNSQGSVSPRQQTLVSSSVSRSKYIFLFSIFLLQELLGHSVERPSKAAEVPDLTTDQKAFLLLHRTSPVKNMNKKWSEKFQRKPPHRNTIRRVIQRVTEENSISSRKDRSGRQRTVRTVAAIQDCCCHSGSSQDFN